jgi:hypothetical protein
MREELSARSLHARLENLRMKELSGNVHYMFLKKCMIQLREASLQLISRSARPITFSAEIYLPWEN